VTQSLISCWDQPPSDTFLTLGFFTGQGVADSCEKFFVVERLHEKGDGPDLHRGCARG
jgi:hypothetical protein